jgi:hypothetical protein
MNQTREKWPDIPTLLAAIRKRPGMFLGKKSITLLQLLLNGIELAEDFHDIPLNDRMGGFDERGFEEWVEAKSNPKRLTLNAKSLAAYIAGNESDGFDLWFSWYDEFLSLTTLQNRPKE